MCGSNLCDTHIHTYRDIHAQSRHIHTQTKTNTPVIRARAAAKARAFVLVAALFLDFAARQNKRHIHISTYPQTHTDTQINTQHTFDWSEGGCDSERACPCRRAVPWFRRARPKKKTYTLIHTHIYICPTHLLLERERLREQERLSLSPRRSLISPRVQKNKSYTHIHIYTYTQHTFCWSASGCESESACPCRRAVPWFRHPFLSPYPAPHQSTGPAASWPFFFSWWRSESWYRHPSWCSLVESWCSLVESWCSLLESWIRELMSASSSFSLLSPYPALHQSTGPAASWPNFFKWWQTEN